MPDGPYELRYLPLFLSDLEDAVHRLYHVLGNPGAAERLVDELERKLSIYRENPFASPPYRSAKDRPETYRRFEVGHYLVFYVVLDHVMEVRRLLYGARDLTRLVP